LRHSPIWPNKKAERSKGSSFGSSAMLRLAQHPPLSAPFPAEGLALSGFQFDELFSNKLALFIS
jgi:hypothetical protein